MFSKFNPQTPDLNSSLSGIITGIASSALTWALTTYVVQPVVQKGVDKIVPPEQLELTAEVVEDEENAGDTK